MMKCPHCGTEIQANANVGLEKMNATCPNCKQASQIGQYLPKCSLKVGSKNYQLRFGKQWVGRKSPVSEADVQIPDETKYMSKKHAQVMVSCTAAGLSFLYEENAKNPTTLHGIELVEGDIVYLSPNDCLKLGDVQMYLAPEFGE